MSPPPAGRRLPSDRGGLLELQNDVAALAARVCDRKAADICAVGMVVGSSLGLLDGICVGSCDGLGVGSTLGRLVGEIVGFSDHNLSCHF